MGPTTSARGPGWLPLVAVALVAAVACQGSSAQNTPPPNVSVAVGNPGRAVTLTESGSSLVLPYLQRMVAPFHSDYPNVTLAPAGGGSGKGVNDAISGAVVMGGSDAYLSDGQAAQNPDLLDIPIATSAQAINYNLPGVDDLRLSGDVIARIYEGRIGAWNDPAIARLNPGVSLPSTAIVPVRRSDASGDTFLFTAFLTATNADWRDGPAYSTTVTWPSVQGERTVTGNPAMVQVCGQTPGCIAYVGISAEAAATTARLGEARLQNRAGQFLQPTPATITAAKDVAGSASIPTDLRESLIDEDGAQSYPIVNYEYLMVRSQQPDADTALAVRTFLAWAVDGGKGGSPANLRTVGFVALPTTILPWVRAAIARVTS
jgi:phosphate transport system substrate-binding protein